MSGGLYFTPRAMRKLSWFLRDFGYDSEPLGKNAIDDKALIDLRSVIKVTVHGISISKLRQVCTVCGIFPILLAKKQAISLDWTVHSAACPVSSQSTDFSNS